MLQDPITATAVMTGRTEGPALHSALVVAGGELESPQQCGLFYEASAHATLRQRVVLSLRRCRMTNNVPQNSLVVVADGSKAIFFRNERSEASLSLREEQRLSPKNLLDDGPSGSRPEEQTPRQTAEATFAKQLAEAINKMKQDGKFENLVLVADPQTLGQLRDVMHKTVQDSIVLTLAKDLTNHPTEAIADLIGRSAHRVDGPAAI